MRSNLTHSPEPSTNTSFPPTGTSERGRGRCSRVSNVASRSFPPPRPDFPNGVGSQRPTRVRGCKLSPTAPRPEVPRVELVIDPTKVLVPYDLLRGTGVVHKQTGRTRHLHVLPLTFVSIGSFDASRSTRSRGLCRCEPCCPRRREGWRHCH